MSLLDSETPGAIGSYTVVGVLGRGGGGTVFQGISPQGVAVAIKVPQIHDGQDVARFERECRLQHQLGGDGLLPLLDAGRTPRGPYAVLPLLRGGTLADRLRSGPLPWREAVELVRSLSHVVGRLHAAGVVHRDLKPDNVLFDEGGRAWVADLGTSKHSDRSRAPDSVSLSQSGQLTGTPAYMAPEQAFDSKRVGPPADVFALGVILYTVITGERPFPGESLIEIVQSSSAGRYTPLRERLPQTPAWLDLAVRRCLAAVIEERPSALELVELLKPRAPRDGAAARRGSRRLGRPLATRRGPRAQVLGVAGIVLAALILGGTWIVSRPRALDPPPELQTPKPRDSRRNTTPIELVSPDAVRLGAPGPQSSETPTGSSLGPTRELIVQAPGGHIGSVHHLDVSPDGSRVLTGSSNGEVRLWDARSGAQLLGWSDSSLGSVTGVAFGKEHVYAVTSSGELLVHGVRDSKREIYRSGHQACADLDADRTGRLVTAGTDGLRVWPAGYSADSEPPELAVSEPVRLARFGPGGVCVAVGPSGAWTWEDGRIVQLRGWSHEAPFADMDWSPDGSALAILDAAGELTVRTWPEFEIRGRVTVPVGQTELPWRGLCFSEDGRKLFTVTEEGRVRVWQTSDLTPADPPAVEGPSPIPLRSVRRGAAGTLFVVGAGTQLIGLLRGGGLAWPRSVEVQRALEVDGSYRWARDALVWLDDGRTLLLNTIDDLQALDVNTRRILERRGTLTAGRVLSLSGGEARSIVGDAIARASVSRRGDTFVVRPQDSFRLRNAFATDLLCSGNVLFLIGTSRNESGLTHLDQLRLENSQPMFEPIRLPLNGACSLGTWLSGAQRLWIVSPSLSVGLSLSDKAAVETSPPQLTTDRAYVHVCQLSSDSVLLVQRDRWEVAELIRLKDGTVEVKDGSVVSVGIQHGIEQALAVEGRVVVLSHPWIYVFHAKTGELLQSLELAVDDVVADMLASPDGRLLYVWTHRGELWRYTLR